MKTVWVNLIHIYQPPTLTNASLFKTISKRSYLYIIDTLKRFPSAKFTINISGSLTEQLIKRGFKNIIYGLKELAIRNQIEFTSTAKYHPILPLLPKNEILHQIKINDKANSICFGDLYKPSGFFLPEMAYSQKVGNLIAKKFQWVVLDEIAYNGTLPANINPKTRYILKGTKLSILFRNRKLSKSYIPKTILENRNKNDFFPVVITATDGEMYGYYHRDTEKMLKKALQHPEIKTLTVSQYLKTLKITETVNPLKSSWETTEQDIKNNNPYPLWSDPNNKIQQKLWQLAQLAIRTNHIYNKSNQMVWPRKHLDRALASCTWWWASNKQVDVFSPIGWDPDTIEKGMNEMIKSVRSLENIPQSVKLRAEKLHNDLKKLIWEKHWKNNET